MADPAIEVRGLDRGVLAGVDLRVAPGTVHAILGPNGAGKTTLVRTVLGLYRPSRGTALVLGRDLATAPPAHRARVGYVAQSGALHGWMTLEEHGRYVARLRPTWDPALFGRLAALFALPLAAPADDLSASDRQKAAIAIALASRPEVLVLDEPLAGLDAPARRTLLAELIERLTEGTPITILLATASLGGIERIADHVGILDRGRLLVSAALEDLQARYQRLQLVFDGPVPRDLSIEGARRLRVEGSVATATVEVADGAHRRRLSELPGARVEFLPLGLEDLYLELVGGGRP